MNELNNLGQHVGAVAIGRNEGERLRACLGSLVSDLDSVVYVDSGSDDESLAIAEEFRTEVVLLDTSVGFTAARARNAGFRRLQKIAPEIQYIQFVDGDCEVVEGWIKAGTSFMDRNPSVSVVCGRRRERFPGRNAYHRLADMEWDSPTGEARSCGGDAIIRREAFEQVGGYCESLIAGEEPELCVRLRKQGWKIWRLDHEMTRHDIDMKQFRQWWRRAKRAGHAYAEVASLHGSLSERDRWRKLVSIWIWALLPMISIFLIPVLGLNAILIAGLLYLLSATRNAYHRVRSRHDRFRHACLYATACVAANWPQAIGSLQFAISRLRGSGSRLIEYRESAIGRPTSSSRR